MVEKSGTNETLTGDDLREARVRLVQSLLAHIHNEHALSDDALSTLLLGAGVALSRGPGHLTNLLVNALVGHVLKNYHPADRPLVIEAAIGALKQVLNREEDVNGS